MIRLSPLLLALTLSACSSDLAGPDASLTGTGNTSVTVINDGPVTISDLRILTGETDSLPRITALNAGQSFGPYQVGVLHSAPFVQATVQGRALLHHPVEGFSGFNPALAQGSYVIRMRPSADGAMLDIRVSAATP